jgi:polyketide cyclase/dehydrase/lipid transport protein
VPNVIDYDGTFSFAVPVEGLWRAIARLDQFSSWWGWLHDYTVEGTGLEAGTVLHGVVAPPLPYRMRLDVVLGECVPERSIAAEVHGDLEGAAQLTFDGDGRSTRAHATWTIEMMQRPMRLAARYTYPLFRWGHDRVVEATVDGFRRSALDGDR